MNFKFDKFFKYYNFHKGTPCTGVTLHETNTSKSKSLEDLTKSLNTELFISELFLKEKDKNIEKFFSKYTYVRYFIFSMIHPEDMNYIKEVCCNPKEHIIEISE